MKKQLILAFGQADRYAEQALLQKRVAQTLAARLPSLARPAILELGCGTGFLTRHLLQRWPEAPLLCSDLAYPMLQRCRASLGAHPNLRYAVLDGEQPAVAAGFDLIAASMVMQWFTRPLASLAGLFALLQPGGVLAFATLGPETFQEWRQACTALALPNALADRPTAADWQQAWPATGLAQTWEESITLPHPSGLAFLQGLRAIGAHLPIPAYRPLSAGQLRRLLRHLEQQAHGGTVEMTYHVIYGLFRKNGVAALGKNGYPAG
ncbi:MAG: methyltransferase [Magnetococcales bacterium]|nr:methyltransferase [Magnetococcales bacterium]